MTAARADDAAWRRPTAGERRWPVALAVAVAIALQVALPDRLGLQPAWLLPGLETALLVVLVATDPGRMQNRHPALRTAGLVLVGLISGSNALSAGLLVAEMLRGSAATGSAGSLLASGGAVYGTNVLAFALWYWEWDRGGPVARTYGDRPFPDLLFPQMATPGIAPPTWEPQFLDYLYVSLTNATAFSPTDTMPLSRWAKALMALQSVVALHGRGARRGPGRQRAALTGAGQSRR